MLDSFGINPAVLFNLSPREPACKLTLQTLMRVGLDVENIFPVIARNLADMWGIGIQRIFNQKYPKVAITLAQCRAQSFGGVAFAVVFLRPVLLEYGFKI